MYVFVVVFSYQPVILEYIYYSPDMIVHRAIFAAPTVKHTVQEFY